MEAQKAEQTSTFTSEDRVLVTGIYLKDEENNIEDIAAEFSRSRNWSVEQKWIGLGSNRMPKTVEKVTALQMETLTPKFLLLNRLLGDIDLSCFRFVIVCDDDICLPREFVDNYLDLVIRYRFSLAQPSRTHDSYIDWPFVEQLDGITARWTRYVEIGPVFSVSQEAFPMLFPFDEASPMGWGYDFVWPRLMEKHGLRMGIVDAVPVAHNLRKPVGLYDHAKADRTMQNYLLNRSHLPKEESFTIVESYA